LPEKKAAASTQQEDLEGTPADLREGAAQIAELYDYVNKNPATKTSAVGVFKTCAENDRLLTALRAYCYAKAVRLGLELGQEFWDPRSVSDEIKNLSREL